MNWTKPVDQSMNWACSVVYGSETSKTNLNHTRRKQTCTETNTLLCMNFEFINVDRFSRMQIT